MFNTRKTGTEKAAGNLSGGWGETLTGLRL